MVRSAISISEALADPAAVFATPEQVVGDPRLDRTAKIEILRRWEVDARALLRAEDESMTGGEPSMLARVRNALRILGGGGAC